MPISLCLFFLSPRFGKLAAEVGPRLPMTVGPLVAGAGMLLFMRLDPGASYLVDVLPSVLLFGLGMSMTVAPLTATVLDSVSPNRVGIASGINNGVSRVAGLLAIAVLGAVISAHFGARLDSGLGTGRSPRRRPRRSPKPRNSRSACRRPKGCGRVRRGGSSARRATPRPRPSISAPGWRAR